MSRTAATASGAGAGVKAAGGIVFVVVMALVVLLIVRAAPAVEPFDPRSGQPDGARGLVSVLEAAGADVDDTRTVPAPGADTRVLVLDDRLDDDQRAALLSFIDAGGVAVVADPESTLHGGAGLDGGARSVLGRLGDGPRFEPEREANVAPGTCTIPALGRLRGVYVPDGLLFPVGPDEPQCFTSPPRAALPGTSFVIVSSIGTGTVVGLGDNEPFVNRNLRRADNAGVAAALLVPERGVDVTFLLGTGAAPTIDDVGTGDQTLRDLIPPWVWMSLVLAAVAFVVFAISRAISPGRIVSEPVTSPVAGSELVSATGNLMERAGHATRAGSLLLGRLHRDLCRSHDVGVSAPLADLDRAVAERSSVAPGEVERLLARSVSTDAALAELSASIDAMRRSIATDDTPNDPRPTADAAERVNS